VYTFITCLLVCLSVALRFEFVYEAQLSPVMAQAPELDRIIHTGAQQQQRNCVHTVFPNGLYVLHILCSNTDPAM
jgi:hypothetical protein